MENRDKQLKRIRQIIFGVLGIGGIFATYFLARALSGPLNQPDPVAETEEAAVSAMQEMIVIVPDDAPPPAAALTEEEIFNIFAEARNDNETAENEEVEDTEESVTYAGPIDFEALWEVNKDVYAWISVAGTIIDYPILQHPTDNTKYLNYNIDGSHGLPGCIYTENMNAKDFSDPHTVIYGHNMRNGTMFAKLHEFRKNDFFEKNRDITIYLPEGEITYKIFAAYVYDDRHLMYSFDFKNPDVYASYLKTVFGIRDMNANIDKDMVITKDDKIITLVTCVSGQDDKRLLVQAVRTENGQE